MRRDGRSVRRGVLRGAGGETRQCEVIENISAAVAWRRQRMWFKRAEETYGAAGSGRLFLIGSAMVTCDFLCRGKDGLCDVEGRIRGLGRSRRMVFDGKRVVKVKKKKSRMVSAASLWCPGNVEGGERPALGRSKKICGAAALVETGCLSRQGCIPHELTFRILTVQSVCPYLDFGFDLGFAHGRCMFIIYGLSRERAVLTFPSQDHKQLMPESDKKLCFDSFSLG